MHELAIALMAAGIMSMAGGTGATSSCSSVLACIMGINSANGPGVSGMSSLGFGLSGVSTSGHGVNGVSTSSFGVVGITKANGSPETSTARAGVLGQDNSAKNQYDFSYNSGVAGTSRFGRGVSGGSATQFGVVGLSNTDVGVCGLSSNSQPFTTPIGCGFGGHIGVVGEADDGVGVIGASAQGTALEGFSTGGYGAMIENFTDIAPALYVSGGTQSGAPKPGSELVVVQDNGVRGKPNHTIFSIDHVGNVVIAGKLAQNGTCQAVWYRRWARNSVRSRYCAVVGRLIYPHASR